MNSVISKSQRLLSLGVLGGVLLVIWFGAFLPIRAAFADMDARIVSANATTTRLERVIQRLENTPQSEVIADGILWQGETANLIQAALQKTLGETADTHQIRFNSVTPLAIGEIEGFSTVALRVEGRASYANLLAFIQEAFQAAPQIGMSSISIRQLPAQVGVPEVSISFQITFWAAMEGGDGA